jgi:hypothetical protein
MSTKENLKKFHAAAATHHTTIAKSHKRLATHYSKATEMDGHKDLAAEHKAMCDSHTTMAEHHLEMCKGIDDEMGKAFGDRLVPDQVSGILREWPPNVTLAPRAGAPQAPIKPNVPLEFEKLVSVDDD